VPKLFALDHNFPLPIVHVLNTYTAEAELVPLQDIDSRLPEFEDDWRILLALHHDSRPWDGMITTDSSMVQLPRELATLIQTKLTLVVALDAGHDPLKATGLLFAYLPGICKRTRPDDSQLWQLRAADRAAAAPWDQLQRVANHQNRPTQQLYDEEKLSARELSTNPLA
jgi:hypothetical protein